MPRIRLVAGVAATALLLNGGAVAQSQQTTGPVATYWVTAQTSSGMPAMGAGGANPMAMMAAMADGGGAKHSLFLQLQSSMTASGTPRAAHEPPAALRAGASLPLAVATRSAGSDEDESWERPDGDAPRMLIYFGCGEAAGRSQPVIVDLRSNDSARQLASLMAGQRVERQRGPSAGAGRTYAEWPNARARSNVSAESSLVGDHLVRGNYTPDIRFSLNAQQDFLAPLQLTGVDGTGPHRLGWNSIAGARAYLAYTFGENRAGDIVVWSSSAVASMPMALPELLSPTERERLLRSRVLLPASTTQCAIPTAVTEAAPESMLRVVAYGDEVNISYPERPADRSQPWNIQYAVKVRYGSSIGTVLGMDMSEEDGDSGEARRGLNPVDALPIPGAGLVGSLLGGLRRRN